MLAHAKPTVDADAPAAGSAPGFSIGGHLRRRRPWYLALAAAYLVSVGLLFTSHVREFADESDNLLGGVVLVRGARLYVDYFSSHMPLAYYVAAIPAAFGAVGVEDFRPFTNALLILATLLFVWGFRRGVGVELLGLWAVLTIFAHTLQFGEMLLAGTLAGFGVLAAGLIVYTTPGLRFVKSPVTARADGQSLGQPLKPSQVDAPPRFDWLRAVALSAAVWVALQSALLAAYPLAVLAVAYLWTRRARAIRETMLVAAIVIVPHVLTLGWLWANGTLAEFFYDAVQFNQTFYSQYLMSGSPVQMLHDWEAQYRTYVAQSLSEPLGLQSVLVVANAVAAVLIGRARGVLVGVAYYVFAALSHIRTEDGYYLVSYLSLAVIGVASVKGIRRRRSVVPAIAGLALVGVFVVRVALTYDFSRLPPREAAEVPIVRALTQPGDRIFVAPYDPYVYLATERMPAATSPFYFPWQAIDRRTEDRLMAELEANRPPVIVFRQDELVNGQWLPREYGRRVLDALLAEYAPLDASAPTLRDVLVPQEKLAEARRRVAALGY